MADSDTDVAADRPTTGATRSAEDGDPAAETAGGSVFPLGARIGWAVAGVVALAAVVVAHSWQLRQPPLPGRHETVPITGYLAGGLELVSAIAAVGTIGCLLAVCWGYRQPDRGRPWKLDHSAYPVLAAARGWALAWGLSSLLLVPINAADTGGVPLSYVVGELGDYLSSTQTVQARLLTAVVALVVALGCWLNTTWRWTIGTTAIAVPATLPSVVTAQVSVGAGHDFATDAAIVYTLVTTFWFAAIWSRPRTAERIGAERTRRRIGVVGLIAVAVALVTRVGIGVFELAGQRPFDSAYGVVLTATVLLLVLLGLRLLLGWRTSAVADRGWAIDRALIIGLLGAQTALLRLVPPRFRVPQTPAENYLGYNLPDAPTLATALQPGRPNLLLLTIAAVLVGLYLWGVVRVHRGGGEPWPIGRTIAWLLGWAMVVILVGSRMWAYSSATFSWHMVVHMTLNMGAPVLLVMAGPITLLLRATSAGGVDVPVGLHALARTVLSWRPVQVLLHPIVVWVLFVGSLYALYLSPLFDYAMRYHWSHQLMAVHFMITGYLYYWLVIGVDRPPRPLPHIAKLGYVFAAMPFHAFFAVALLSGGRIVGENFYTSLDLAWLTDLAAQQSAGGQVTWATGEIPLFVVIIALVAQWFRQDQREARRLDRAADSGHDDSLQAYNEMLAALAARDRGERGGPPSTSSGDVESGSSGDAADHDGSRS